MSLFSIFIQYFHKRNNFEDHIIFKLLIARVHYKTYIMYSYYSVCPVRGFLGIQIRILTKVSPGFYMFVCGTSCMVFTLHSLLMLLNLSNVSCGCEKIVDSKC